MAPMDRLPGPAAGLSAADTTSPFCAEVSKTPENRLPVAIRVDTPMGMRASRPIPALGGRLAVRLRLVSVGLFRAVGEGSGVSASGEFRSVAQNCCVRGRERLKEIVGEERGFLLFRYGPVVLF